MRATRFTGLFSIVALAAVTALASGCIVHTNEDDATLTVVNDSSYVLVELNLVDPGDPWGPNYIGPEGLYPGEELVLFDIECDWYDARLIDEDGNECPVYDLDLCLNDATWYVTNNTCDVFGAKDDGDTVTPQ